MGPQGLVRFTYPWWKPLPSISPHLSYPHTNTFSLSQKDRRLLLWKWALMTMFSSITPFATLDPNGRLLKTVRGISRPRSEWKRL